MRRALVALFGCLVTLGASSCTTEACACTPAIVPALVTGRVLREGSVPVPDAHVRAYSATAEGCNSLDTDFGFVTTDTDGGYRMGLSSGDLRDSVCVLVFARPPLGTGALTETPPGPRLDSQHFNL